MAISPSNILAKLEELKKWQEKQQERLLEQHNKRLEQNSFTPTERNFIKNSLGVDVASKQKQSDTKQTASSPKKPKKSLQGMMMEGNGDTSFINNASKPKQPFLRRGAGLSRFRMTPGEQFKSFPKTSATNRSNYIQTTSSGSTNKVKEVVKPVITPLKRPDVSLKPKASWHTTLSPENQVAVKVNNPNEVSAEIKDKDLLIFEALEQRAMHNSFCSTNSSIVRLLSSTPQKNSPLKPNNSQSDSSVVQEKRSVQQVYGNGAQFEAVYARQRTAETHEDAMRLRYVQNKRTPVIEEIIDDVLADNAKTMRENAEKLQEIDEYEKKLQNEYLMLIEKALTFKQYVAGDKESYYSSSTSCSSSVTSGDLDEEHTLQETKFDDKKKWSDLETYRSESESASSSVNTTQQATKRDIETMTEEILCDDSQEIANKMQELEKELKTIRIESAKNEKVKSRLEQQRKEFEKHKKEILKEVEDEKVRINFLLDEERKKIAKEKMVFERYVKESQNKPSKKEREEVAVLKTEVASLKETLKLKETKSGLAQARLRNQIKSLEKENAALKQEVEKLNRQNGKLVASQKLSRKPSDTKMLHMINKNLTKLAQEQLSKRATTVEKELLLSSSDEDDPVVEAECKKKVKTNLNGRRSVGPLQRTRSESDDKENDRNVTNNKQRSMNDVSTIEESYERIFRTTHEAPGRLSNGTQENHKNQRNDRTEEILSDGTRRVHYNNGNVKTVSPDGNYISFKYFNGDIKETNLLEGTITYHYHENRVKHTTHADGTELIEFPDGQTEKRLKDGACEAQYPNGIIRRTHVDGTEEINYPDGTTVTVNTQGERILLLPNGQKEVHTKEHKRREYPDGTVKILYPDGLQETRYASGRVRVKDRNGKLLMDSQNTAPLDV